METKPLAHIPIAVSRTFYRIVYTFYLNVQSYVCFVVSDPSSVDKCVQVTSHTILGKRVEVKPAYAKDWEPLPSLPTTVVPKCPKKAAGGPLTDITNHSLPLRQRSGKERRETVYFKS